MTKEPDFIQIPTTPGRPETPPSMRDSKRVPVTGFERKDHPPEYLLDRVEELAVKVYSLTNERDELEAKLVAMTSERNELKAQLDAVPMAAIKIAFDTSTMAEWGNDDWNAQSDALGAWLREVTK